MDVAFAAAAALAEEELFTVLSQICNRRQDRRRRDEDGFRGNLIVAPFLLDPSSFIFIDHGSNRDLYDLRNRPAAMHLLPLPVLAVLGLDDRLVEKVGKVI